MKKALARVSKLKPYRVYQSYSQAGGNLSAAGMSFQTFFAVFAAVWVGFSISGLYLNDHPDMKRAVIKFINLQIPNLIAPGGAIDPDVLTNTALGWTGAIATVVLAYTAINWIQYTRIAMHRIFGLPKPALNFLLLKLWDLVIALIYVIVIFIGASLTATASSIFTGIVKWLNIDQSMQVWTEYALRIAIFAIVFVLDVVLLALMIRILSGVKIPYRFLWRGVTIAGIALGIMRFAGGALLDGASKNPLFATFTIFVGLLVWFNLMCRIYLLTAEWIATSMRDAGFEPVETGWIFTRETLKRRVLRRP